MMNMDYESLPKSKLDCISRKQAKEAIEKEIERIRENPCAFIEGDFYYQNALKLAQEIIELQPPVTPTERKERVINMSFDGMVRCRVVDTLPDVLGIIFLVPKEEKDKSGKTITVYEEYVFMKRQIGVVHPDDIEKVVFYEHGGILNKERKE